MSNQYNSILLRHVLQLTEQDVLNDRIERLLEKNIETITFRKNEVSIKFKNGISIIIKPSFDIFYLYISDSKVYQNGESPFSPMSSDRIHFYLKSIANLLY